MEKRKPSAASKTPKRPEVVYRFKITLKHVSPPIWRRVEVADGSLADLHRVIQSAMGWSDSHLHEFEIGGDRFAAPSSFSDGDLDEMDCMDASEATLAEAVGNHVKTFRYTYDFGDGWDHTIQVEGRVAPEAGVSYPRCLGGARACPPEDCGGPGGFAALLKKLANPKHPEHKETREWLGGGFDPAKFDLDDVNKALNGGR